VAAFLENSVYFGVLLTLISCGIGTWLKRKTGLAVCNPLLIAIVLTIGAVLVFKVDYTKYTDGADYMHYLLTPATVCLAVPLYRQFGILRRNYKAVLIGILSGVISSLTTVFLMSLALGLDHQTYVTLLPKSITTAIGMVVAEELGGYGAITAAIIVVTGVLGNMIAHGVCKLFRITHPVAIGVGIGSASHAGGTARAIEMGETEGAMSSLSIVVAGLMTVVLANFFAPLLT